MKNKEEDKKKSMMQTGKKKLMELKEEYERLVRLRQSEADSEKDRV